MREIPCPKAVEPCISKLGLRWPVRWLVKGDSTLRIASQAGVGHEITVPPSFLKRLELGEGKYDFVHELCHAYLGEQRHIFFAVMPLDPRLEARGDFSERAAMFYQACAPVQDIFVDDVMYGLDRTLVYDDVRSVMQSAKKMARRGMMKLIPPADLLLPIALAAAEVERHNISGRDPAVKGTLAAIDTVFGREATAKTKALASFYASLPRLPRDAVQAVRLLELSTQAAARILGLPIDPRVIVHEGREAWSW